MTLNRKPSTSNYGNEGTRGQGLVAGPGWAQGAGASGARGHGGKHGAWCCSMHDRTAGGDLVVVSYARQRLRTQDLLLLLIASRLGRNICQESLLCSALYAKRPCYSVLYIPSVLIIQCFICQASLVCSALYAKRPCYSVLYMPSVLII